MELLLKLFYSLCYSDGPHTLPPSNKGGRASLSLGRRHEDQPKSSFLFLNSPINVSKTPFRRWKNLIERADSCKEYLLLVFLTDDVFKKQHYEHWKIFWFYSLRFYYDVVLYNKYVYFNTNPFFSFRIVILMYIKIKCY